jgi:protein gp37
VSAAELPDTEENDMSANSKIEWCDHSWNLVWGCQRVSPGCQNCYAESLAKRYGFDVWGPAKTTERRTMSEGYWAQPLLWNAAAEKAGTRAKVFCSSMADVFEDHPANNRERPKLWTLIEQTPMLDWLLLTKRPENMNVMAPAAWASGWPEHVIAMTSVESQEYADTRIPELRRVPAMRRGLSCEPLLGPASFRPKATDALDMLRLMESGDASRLMLLDGIHWIITGGESGPGARPGHVDWYRGLRDQALAAGVAFHFKQWGEWIAAGQVVEYPTPDRKLYRWPDGAYSSRIGKKAAGRLLDGRTWDEFPQLLEVH